MTPEALLALMLTMRCHTLSIDIPERRETIAYTVCVRVVDNSPPPVVKKPVKKKKKYKKRRRR
jgi:hypothetical protein